ncbi:MAG: hypothetical protein CSA33_01075 [Desulfobulbus propionicus]|nr:MAG: hypothetical protein CSA33_01075 [Desulfobulbus propionicus]
MPTYNSPPSQVSHEHVVLFEKKEKTDGYPVRGQALILTECAPRLSPGSTIFESILATQIPK